MTKATTGRGYVPPISEMTYRELRISLDEYNGMLQRGLYFKSLRLTEIRDRVRQLDRKYPSLNSLYQKGIA